MLRKAELVVVAITLALGWLVSLSQAAGGAGGTGTLWLLMFSVVASAGAWLRVVVRRPLPAAGALLLVAVSPTGFAYVFNLVLVVFAVVEVAHGLARRPKEDRLGAPLP